MNNDPKGMELAKQPAALSVVSKPQLQEDAIDLIELMYRMLDAWKFFVAAILLGALLGGLYAQYRVTPMYSAKTTLYVVSNKDSVINMSDLQLGTAITKDYISVFQIWEVHEQVLTNLNLSYSYGQIQSMISVVNPNGTRMLEITARSSSPQLAASIANEYAEVGRLYIADHMAIDKPSVMSTARVPTAPYNVNKPRMIMMGALIGAALVAAFVVLKYLLDDKIRTADDVAKYTGLTNLASIPKENPKQKGGD